MPYIPRELPFGEHVFVFARPLTNWSDFDGSTMASRRGTDPLEFRPCMIKGHDSGQCIYVIGSAYSYDPGRFEIGDDIFLNHPLLDPGRALELFMGRRKAARSDEQDVV